MCPDGWSSSRWTEIRAFLQAEIELLDDIVTEGMSVIDVGCGTGRHLALVKVGSIESAAIVP